MSSLDKSALHQLKRYVVFFIVGMIVGSVIFLYLHGGMMDKLLLENRRLVNANAMLQDELKTLEQEHKELSQRSQQKLTIKKLQIEVLDSSKKKINGFVESEVTERLRNDLKFLLTLPLESIAETSDTIIHLVNGKKYQINQEEIGLKVEELIIYTTLTLRISITSSIPQSSSVPQ